MRRQDGLRMTLQPSRSAPQKIDLLFENEVEKKREKTTEQREPAAAPRVLGRLGRNAVEPWGGMIYLESITSTELYAHDSFTCG